jgi:uncharacterized phage infection (PIP) family protein YhgE
MKNVAAALLLALVAACGSLPNVAPFADATSALSASVKTSGQAITDSLRDAGSLLPQNKDAYEKDIRDFDAAWQARIKAAEGAVAYANAIADVVAAAGETRETVARVGDSLAALAGAAGIALPAAPVVGVAKDIGEFVAARIAEVRASATLREAVTRAQPAIDRIADHLVKDSNEKLKPILEQVHKNVLSAISDAYDADDNFARVLAKRLSQARSNALADPGKAGTLQELDRMQTAVAPRLKERDQKLDQASANYKARLQLINGLSTATLAWAAAHRDLADAIAQKRRVNTAELRETIAELRELIRKVRAL